MPNFIPCPHAFKLPVPSCPRVKFHPVLPCLQTSRALLPPCSRVKFHPVPPCLKTSCALVPPCQISSRAPVPSNFSCPRALIIRHGDKGHGDDVVPVKQVHSNNQRSVYIEMTITVTITVTIMVTIKKFKLNKVSYEVCYSNAVIYHS